MNCLFRSYDLQLKNTFTISRESYNTQTNMIVRLEWDGYSGLGECTTNPFYNVTVPYLSSKLTDIQSFLSTYDFTHPEILHRDLVTLMPNDPFVLCAIDIAAWDLYAKIKGKPLYQVWGLEWKNIPLTNFTIGIDTIEEMVNKMKEMPWPLYKIKLGTNRDIEIVKALREHTHAIFRIDANCAWTAEQTIEYAPALKSLGVEFIEQPVKGYDFDEAAKAKKGSVLPIIADESCQVEADVLKCVGHFDGINIKLVKCGGLTPALRMIKEARIHDLKVMVGCMTESSVGISAIAHLLPLLDYVDMDGALLLKEDIATGIQIENGKCLRPEAPGTSASLLNPLQ